jgi:hypothetical protein
MLLSLTVVSVLPASAGNGLIPAGKPVAVAKSRLMVTPDREWNRMGVRRVSNSEGWTLDGDGLNLVTFYGGIVSGKTLFRDTQKKTAPLPAFSSTMIFPDIPTLYEASYRIAMQTSLLSIDSVSPGSFAGVDGVVFNYSFVKQDGVRRQGEARAAIVDGKLFMMTYEAPAIHYYGRDLEGFRALAATARLGGKK